MCRSPRSDPDLRDVRIVLASSAFVDDADRELARRAGADEYVVRAPELTAIVEALQGAPSSGPAATGGQVEQYDKLYSERLAQMAATKDSESAELAVIADTQRAQLLVFAGISEALGRCASVGTALGEVLQHCLEATGLAGAAIHMLDPASGRLVPRAVAGLRPRIEPKRLREALVTGRPALTSDVIAAPCVRARTRSALSPCALTARSTPSAWRSRRPSRRRSPSRCARADRALGRQRLPARPARRGDPAGGTDRRDRRRLRRADQRPRLPAAHAGAARRRDHDRGPRHHFDPSLLDAFIASLDAVVAIGERPQAALP